MPYAIDLTTRIEAPPEKVWRALVEPAAVVRWDTTVTAALDAPPDYPRPGQHVRWRCRNTSEILHDRPQEVEPERRLRSLLEFGRQRMDETYTLEATRDGGTEVHLCIDLTVRARLMAAPILLRLLDGPATGRSFEASLTNLKFYCEMAPD